MVPDAPLFQPVNEIWYQAAVPLPQGEEAEAFIRRLTDRMCGSSTADWAWAPNPVGGQGAVFLAARGPALMASLLANIEAMNGTGEKAETWLRSTLVVSGGTQRPDEATPTVH
jgi:hypothetical protein